MHRGAAQHLRLRLSPFDRAAILESVAEVAGPEARVLLFGSRARDDLRGGEIDLLVEMPQPGSAQREISTRVGPRIERRIGLRKIDVLVADPATPDSPALNTARRDGLPL